MPRPPVKATLRLAEAAETGKLRAQQKAHQKKPLAESFKEHLGKMIDRVDPLETLAVFSGTLVVYHIIQNTTEIYNQIVDFSKTKQGFLTKPLIDWLSIALGQTNIIKETDAQKIPNDVLLVIAVSFLVSYLLFRKGGVLDLRWGNWNSEINRVYHLEN